MNSREVKEGRLRQGVDESISYTITTTPWASSPGTLVTVAYDITDGARTDVSVTVLSGSPSASGDIITLPKLQALTAGHLYRVEQKFTCSGNIFKAYFEVEAEL